jgi:signal transduction histidine kinase
VVEVGLVATEGDIVLTVRDDGKGITTDSIESSESLGIIGMRERAMLINGHVSIRGVPGEGTTVSVTVPLQSSPKVVDAHLTG